MVERNKRSGGCRASAGFTLVELMVVISIIGMLMALLLPAVQGARETGRRNTCQSNQKNVAFALQQYNDTKKSYPGWNNYLSASAASTAGYALLTTAGLEYGEVTYIVPLLPFLERSDVYNNYSQYLNTILSGTANSNQLAALSVSQVYMALLVCPSNPPITQQGATPLAYVINGGQIDSGGTPVTQGGVYAALNPQTVAASSGIAYDQTALTGTAVRVSQDYVNSHDGTAYTLLLSENTLAISSWSLLANTTTGTPGWGPYGTSLATAAITSSSTAPYAQQCATTFMWVNSTTANSSTAPSGYFPINGDNNNTTPGSTALLHYARPASNHNGVSVFSFCGGNVKPLAADIDYRIYKQLMTPYGGSTVTATSPSGSGDIDSITTVLDESKF
jgi:prepilin-type N-terminal cleavage/methylation domain-containing protein